MGGGDCDICCDNGGERVCDPSLLLTNGIHNLGLPKPSF